MIAYLIKITLCWSISYAGYAALLRHTTFFQLNRFFLLGTFILSLLIPLLPWATVLPWLYTNPESPAVYMLPVMSAAPENIQALVQAAAPRTPVWQQVLWSMYALGAFLFVFRLGLALWKLWAWRKQGQKEFYPEFCLVHTEKTAMPFSFFRWLYWPSQMEAGEPESRQILEHEIAHIRQWHSLDLFIVEAVSALLWFHPLPRMYGIALRNVHEYLADKAALRKGSRKGYGRLLIRQALMGNTFPLVHNFSPAQLKKRIKMMTTHQTRPGALLRYALLLPLPLLAGAWFAKRTPALPQETPATYVSSDSTPVKQLNSIVVVGYGAKKEQKDTILPTAEVMPQFYSDDCIGVTEEKEKQACSMNALMKHLGKTLVYPELARQEKIEGMVVVSFVIDEAGNATNVKVVKDIGGGCGTEAMRVVETTRWTPGFNQGKPVKVEMKLPINFRLGQEKAAPTPQPAPAPAPEPSADANEIFMVVEEMPVFSGCETIADPDEKKKCSDQKLFEFIAQNLKYPKTARENGIEGIVVVEFIIDKTGAVTKAKILKDVGAGCGEEALRVVSLMPKWTPGIQRGRQVSVALRLPVKFKVQADPAAAAPQATPSADPEKPLPLSELKNFSLSPNPNDGVFTLQFQPEGQPGSVTVFNKWGEEIERVQIGSSSGLFQKTFNLHKQPKGTYLIFVQQNGKGYSGTIVLQ